MTLTESNKWAAVCEKRQAWHLKGPHAGACGHAFNSQQRRGLCAGPQTRALNDAFTEFTAFGDLAGGWADLLRHTGRLEVNAYRQAARSLTTILGSTGVYGAIAGLFVSWGTLSP